MHTKIFSNLLKTHLSRFLTIIAITTLAIAFMTGMLSTRDNLLNTINQYYDEVNVSDFNIKSNYFFTTEEIDYFNSLNDTIIKYSLELPFVDDNSTYIFSFSNNNDVNTLTVLEGRLPLNEMEIVVSDNVSSTSITYNNLIYSVVGKVKSPLSFEKGDGFKYVFTFSQSNELYNNAYITYNKLNKYNHFDDSYRHAVLELKNKIETDNIILTLQENSSFVTYKSYVDIIQKISNVIPFFFIAVAALVILSSITRTLDQDRNRIGILRFLGYSKRYIFSLYLLLFVLSILIGSSIGMVSGFRLIPTVIYNTFSSVFVLPELNYGFYYTTSFLCVLGLLSIVILITIGELSKKLKETITELLRPRAPKSGKTIFLEKITFIWKRLSFKYKNTFRNLFLYKNRLIMTIIGIMGCSALIFTGLGLNDSVSDIANTQYNKLLLFQADVNTTEIIEIDKEIYYFYQKSIVIDNIKESEQISLIVVDDKDNLNKFINLTNVKGKTFKYNNEVVITENIARFYKIKEGDIITLQGFDYKVDVIAKSFLEPLIIISKGEYKLDTEFNKAFIKSITKEEIEEIPSITLNYLTSERENDFKQLSNQISIIMIIVLVAAIILAVVVTYNLTNINIEEREVEIGTLKVLGYKNNEVLGYVYREILIMTVIGAIFGYGLGLLFERYILGLVDSFNLMLSRYISVTTLILSFLITIFVSVIVDLFMIIKLNKIKMISSLVE